MDLNKLRTFACVAELGSITKAAEALYRTQPAISNQLKDLETELKLTLFERRNARIYLTFEGQRLFDAAKEHISQLDDTALRLHKDKTKAEGLIRICVEQASGSVYWPQIIREFRVIFPRVRFQILPGQYDKIEDMLINNEVDFAFLVFHYKPEFLECYPVFNFTRSLVASPEYLRNKPPINSADDLLNLEFVSFLSEFGDLRYWLKDNGLSTSIAQFEKNPAIAILFEANNVNDMILSGVGAGFVFDEMLGKSAFRDKKVVTLLPDYKPMRYVADFACRKIRNETYIQQSFREFVIENCQRWQN